MKQSFTLLIALSCFCFIVDAQQQPPIARLQSVLLPSPEVTALQRYGNWPLGSFTGTPNISIPLFNLTSGKLSLPVSLCYNSGGIKTNDIGGNVGMGWVINAGGQINRNMMGGQPDEVTTSGYWSNYPFPEAQFANDVYAEKTRMELYSKGSFDAQPDVFTYSFGSQSGKFVFDQNQTPNFLPYKNFALNKTVATQFADPLNGVFHGVTNVITNFTITDENGTLYQFNDYDFSQSQLFNYSFTNYEQLIPEGPETGYPNRNTLFTWNLSKIISADRKDTISFIYDVVEIQYDVFGGSNLTVAKQTGGNIPQILPAYVRGRTIVRNTVRSKRLKRIVFNTGYLQFYETTVRKDMRSGGKTLDSIVLFKTNGTRIKSFLFDYQYLKGTTFTTPAQTTTGTAVDSTRLFLKSLQEKGTGANALTHLFTYEHSLPLPPKTMDGGDAWGYPNGKSYKGIGDILTQYSYANFDTSENGLKRLKVSDFNYGKQGVLTGIKYPTGGTTTFEYEPHYKDAKTTVTPVWTYEGNLNIEYSGVDFHPGVANDPDAPEPRKFRVTQTAYPDVSVYLDYRYNNFPTYYYIEIKDSATNAVKYSWYKSSIYCDIYTSNPYPVCTKHLTLSPGTYYITAKNTGQTYSGPYTDIYARLTLSTFNGHYEDVISADSTSVGGIRVKSSIDVDSLTGKKLAKTYEYAEGMKPSVFSGLYLRKTDYYLINTFSTSVGGDDIYSEETQKTLTSNSIYPLIDVGSSYVCYGNVTEKQVDLTTGKINGYTKYTYSTDVDDYQGETDYNFNPYPPYVGQTWRRGLLLGTSYYKMQDDAPVMIKNEKNYYSDLKEKGRAYGEAFYTHYQILDGSQEILLFPTSHDYQSQYFTYHKPFFYRSSYQVLDSNVVDTYGDNGKLNTLKTTFTYDTTTLLPQAITVTNSLGEVAKTRIKRSNDFKNITATDALSSGIKLLQQNHVLAPEIEISTYRSNLNGSNERLTATLFSSYKAGALLKDTLYTLENNQTITGFAQSSVVSGAVKKDARYTPQVSFNQYTSSKNRLAEQQKDMDIKEVYLWGYNSEYPVAKVIGSDYTTAKALTNQNILDSAANYTDAQLRTELNKIRTGLPAAMVTTYTYLPSIGMTSETDVNNNTTFYEYDELSRLKLIKDKDGNILKKFCYNYAGQASPCDVVYTNSVKSGTFTKKTCAAGYTGSTVTYTVPAGTYTSMISPEDANLQAQNDVDANGQNYANSNGTCTLSCSPTTCTGVNKKCISNVCETAMKKYISKVYSGGKWVYTYRYQWSDCSESTNYTEQFTTDPNYPIVTGCVIP